MKPILITIALLALPIAAHADWSPGMHSALGPNFTPNQGQPIHHEIRMNAPAVPQPHAPRPIEIPKERRVPEYFRHDSDYYGHVQVPFPDADVDSPFVVPDGFESVVVDGQIYFYHAGIFYQQIGDQLTAIAPVMGAVVDYIPEDYQIIMADGTHYLFTDGAYYQRVDQGFEVVQPPA